MQRFTLVVLCISACLLWPDDLRSQASRRELQARQTVEQYFTAFARKDLDAVLAMAPTDSPGYDHVKQTLTELFAETGPIELTSLQILSVSVRVRVARISVSVTFSGKRKETDETHPALGPRSGVVELILEKGVWKVVKFLGTPNYYRSLYADLPTREERRRLLGRERELALPVLTYLSESAWDHAMKGDVKTALTHSDLSLEVAEFLDSIETTAWCQLCRGYVFSQKQEYDKALALLEKARPGFQREQQDVGEAVAISQLGRVHLAQGQRDQAREAFERADGLFRLLHFTITPEQNWHPVGRFYLEQIEKRNQLVAKAHRLEREGAIRQAIETMEHVLRIHSALFGKVSEEVAISYAILARHHAWLEKFDLAADYYGKHRTVIEHLYDEMHGRRVAVRVLQKSFERFRALSPPQREQFRQARHTEWQATTLAEQGKLAQAERAQRNAVATFRELLGEASSIYAGALSSLAILLSEQHRFDHAVALYRQADRVWTKVYGANHVKVQTNSRALALTLLQQTDAYYFVGEYEAAVKTLRRRLEWEATRLDTKEDAYHCWWRQHVECLASLPREKQLQAREALAKMRRLRSQRERLVYQENARLADIVSELTKTHRTLRELLGETDWSCFRCQDTAVIYLQARNQLKECLRVDRENLALLRRCGLDQTSQSAAVLHRMGVLSLRMGNLADAGRFLERSAHLYEKTLGRHHQDALPTLTHLADWHDAMGNPDRAVRLRKETVLAYKRHLQLSAPVGDSENLLAMSDPAALRQLGGLPLAYAKALSRLAGSLPIAEEERVLLQQSAILRRLRGNDHPEHLNALLHLADFYYAVGKPSQSKSYALRVEQSLGLHAPPQQRWLSLRTNRLLARLFHNDKDYVQAESKARQRLILVEEVLGIKSDDYRQALLEHLCELEALGRSKDALVEATRLFHLEQEAVEELFRFGSERQMLVYLENRSKVEFGILYSLAKTESELRPTTLDSLWSWTARRKGMLLETLCRHRDAQQAVSDHPELAEPVRRLQDLHRTKTELALHPPGGVSASQLRRDREKVEAEITRLQQSLKEELSRHRPELVVGSTSPDYAEIQRRLPEGSALLEFVKYSPINFTAAWGEMRKQPRYLAFVVRKGEERTRPVLVDLGEAAEIDQLSLQVRTQIEETPTALRTSGEKLLETAYQAKAKTLYTKLVLPLQEALQGSETLLIVPDGNLHQLPFAALVDAQGKYVIESYQCAYLSSTRDLLRPKSSRVGQGVIVFGDPDYDLGVQARIEQTAKLTKSDKGQALTVRGPLLKTRGGTTWNRLQATGPEAKAIEELLSKAGWVNIDVYLRERALEEVLKRVRSPQILHLGTHAEFVKKETPGVERRRSPSELGTEARLGRFENPLLRSYLVLAGGNHPDETESGKVRVEDGLLTAEEAALLQLHGTELVVLSACKSGLGDVRGSEGVYGLRRAFLYAGARTLVTTLFSVPSQESMELMKTFYTGLASSKSKLEALHQAQLETIRARRKSETGAAHPFFWASYSLIGETGPLTKAK